MQPAKRLETDLTDLLMADLVGKQKPQQPADSSDRFPLIEILREAAFGFDVSDEAASTGKFKRSPKSYVIDVDHTTPQELYSAPYEKIDVELGKPRRRRRPATIPRHAMVQRPIRSISAIAPIPSLVRFSAPYELIEIKRESELVAAVRPSNRLVASGSFEAAWFAIPEDSLAADYAKPAAVSKRDKMILGAAVVGAFVLGALTFLAIAG